MFYEKEIRHKSHFLTMVWHTSDILGDVRKVQGDYDYFMNGGRLQPQCIKNGNRKETDLAKC